MPRLFQNHILRGFSVSWIPSPLRPAQGCGAAYAQRPCRITNHHESPDAHPGARAGCWARRRACGLRVDSEHHTRTDRAAGAGGDGVEQPFITVSFSVNGTVEKVRSRARGSERA